MIRRASTKVWRVVGSPAALIVAILLLAFSAVSGNVFQNADRSDLRQDNRELKAQNAALQDQLALVKGQQECRSRIASESEQYSGRLLAGIGKLIVASQEGDDEAGRQAVLAIASATVALTPALEARLNAVELCEEDPDYRTPFSPVYADEPTTTTTAATTSTLRRRSTTTTRAPSTTAGTTSTTFRSSPRPSPDPVLCDLLPITVPREIPCV